MEDCSIYVSAKDDSSSLLPISFFQEENYPGAAEVSTIEANVASLNTILCDDETFLRQQC